MSDATGGSTVDAAGDEPAEAVGRARPTIAGFRFTDSSAVAGGIVWLDAVLAADITAVERALGLAPLVIVPLGLGISRMVSLHGALNAYGFALLGAVGWRIADSLPEL